MHTFIRKTAKFSNLISAYISTYFTCTPAFVRIIPTDRCNLNCKYCWQKSDSSYEMRLGEYRLYLAKAKKLRVGMITFLGGEPMLWKYLYEAIAETSQKNILTDMTTNGLLLNTESIRKLGESGLDYLNISVDGIKTNPVTKKNSVIRNNLIHDLRKAKNKYRMHFRLNSVIFKNNFEETAQLIEFSKENNAQLSLGFIVPPIEKNQSGGQDIYFGRQDEKELRQIVSYIISKKRSGYPIIDPDAYFMDIFRFINREKFWNCNYPTRYGWINITPKGKIRSCTKKMDELDYHFTDLNPDNYRQLRKIFGENVKKCNIRCYSNCAYDSWYYMHNKVRMLKKIISRVRYGLSS
ncbi:MAG: radical SAM protein [Desulfococcaceae bacterium]|jgi:MoaA/NifB/PqqE/SkfB family radical SAM enzyme|nr:radical SAM protein [Desulfococcaceae bacterium]